MLGRALLLVSIAACDDFDFELVVRRPQASAAEVHIDGQARPMDTLRVSYDHYEAGLAPHSIEVWVAGTLRSRWDVTPGACKAICEQRDAPCRLGDLEREQLAVSVQADGSIAMVLEGACTDGETVFAFTP